MLLSGIGAYGASVRLSVENGRGRRQIGVGDLFYITYVVSDTESAPQKPSSVPGAKVMYFDRTGQSSSFTSVNGKTTQSYSYTYTLTLRAEKEGSYSFYSVTVGGVKSNSVSYAIGQAAPQSQPGMPKADSSQPGRHNSEDYLSLSERATAISS